MKTTTTSLPHELVVEILSWLPANYLWKFRCVCKIWLRLLTTDPQFAKLHLDRSLQSQFRNPSSILALQKRAGEKITKFYIAAEYTACDNAIGFELGIICYTLYGICNGLLCLFESNKNNVYILNPLTKEHISIPCSPYLDNTFGFGFHPGTNEYKVIQVFDESNCDTFDFHSRVSVYTLGTDSSWRNLEQDHRSYMCTRSPPVLVNGVLHWLAYKIGPFDDKTGSYDYDMIVSFDLKDEFFQEIQPPNDVSFNMQFESNTIGELGGLLCLFSSFQGEDVQIWVMKEYGVMNSWIKQFRIGRPEVCGTFTYMEPLGVAPYEEIIVRKNNLELIVYNPKTNSIRNLNMFGLQFYEVYSYIGSIISPRVISGAAGHLMT